MLFGEPRVFSSGDKGEGHSGWRVEQTQPHHYSEVGFDSFVDVMLGQKLLFKGLGDAAAKSVEKLSNSGLDGACSRACVVRVVLVVGDHPLHAACIGADYTVLSPLFYRDLFENRVRCAWNSVDGIVGCHVGPGMTIDNAHPKGNRVILSEEAVVEIGR